MIKSVVSFNVTFVDMILYLQQAQEQRKKRKIKMIAAVYRITYPNGKIYIGQDVTNSIGYFGSPRSEFIAKDFSSEQRKSLTITKDILWESETVTKKEVTEMEVRLILENQSNNPEIGYNRFPKYKK